MYRSQLNHHRHYLTNDSHVGLVWSSTIGKATNGDVPNAKEPYYSIPEPSINAPLTERRAKLARQGIWCGMVGTSLDKKDSKDSAEGQDSGNPRGFEVSDGGRHLSISQDHIPVLSLGESTFKRDTRQRVCRTGLSSRTANFNRVWHRRPYTWRTRGVGHE